MQYVSVDTILAKLSREIGTNEINESDVIEAIGEALGFLSIKGLLQQNVAFLEVKNYTAIVPQYFKFVIQLARNNNWVKDSEEDCCTPKFIEEELELKPQPTPYAFTDCNGHLIDDYNVAYYRPFFDLKYEYEGWSNSRLYRRSFTPIRLANNSFYNNLVCRETDTVSYGPDTYTIVGDLDKSVFRFSFREGQVALAYLGTAIDETTGYPLIPEDISVITAITYYCKWKISERLRWEGREGFSREAQDAEAHWLKYVKQAKFKAKKPKTRDEFENLLQASLYIIPDLDKYNNFFGNFNK